MSNKLLVGKLYGISSASSNLKQNLPQSDTNQQFSASGGSRPSSDRMRSGRVSSHLGGNKDDHTLNYGAFSHNSDAFGQSQHPGSSMQQPHSPYDVIEQESSPSRLDETGCISADESIDINEVKNFKQRNQKGMGLDARQKSPNPYNHQSQPKQKKSKYAVTHSNINLAAVTTNSPPKTGKNSSQHHRGLSTKSNGSLNNKNYAQRQDGNQDYRDRTSQNQQQLQKNGPQSKLNNDLQSDRNQQTSGRQNLRGSILSKTSDGDSKLKHVPKGIVGNNQSEYMLINSRQDSAVATNSNNGSQKNYNSQLNTSNNPSVNGTSGPGGPNPKIIQQEQYKILNSQERLIQQLQHSLSKNRTGSGAVRTTPLKSVSRGFGHQPKDIRTLSAAEVEMKAVKDLRQQNRVSLNQQLKSTQTALTQLKKKVETRGSNLQGYGQKTTDLKRQSMPVVGAQQQRLSQKSKRYPQVESRGQYSDKTSEPAVNSRTKGAQDSTKDYQRLKSGNKKIQAARSPKPVKENQTPLRKGGPNSVARQTSPKINRNLQGSPKLGMNRRNDYDLDNRSSKTRQNQVRSEHSNQQRIPRKEMKQIEDSSFSKQDLSNPLIDTIHEQDSNLPTNPTPKHTKNQKSKSLISIKAGHKKQSTNSGLGSPPHEKITDQATEDDEAESIRNKKPRVRGQKMSPTRNSYHSNNKAESRRTNKNSNVNSLETRNKSLKNGGGKMSNQRTSLQDKEYNNFNINNNTTSLQEDSQFGNFDVSREMYDKRHQIPSQAFQSQFTGEIRSSIKSQQTIPHIDQQVMDFVTNNVLTDMGSPSRATVNAEIMEMKYSSKSIDNYDSGIVSVEIDNQQKNSKKARQTDRMVEKKIEYLGHIHRQSMDNKSRQKSEQSNQRALQLRKNAQTDKKKRPEYENEETPKIMHRQLLPARQQKSQLKPKSTQRIIANKPIEQRRRNNAPLEHINLHSNSSKTNRNAQTSIKSVQKNRNKKNTLTQDSSDDYLQTNQKLLNKENESRIERIDFRSTEIELLENEIGHLREKLDRLIKTFDFKLFAKLGKVKDFRQTFGGQTDDEMDDISPISFQNFCQLLLKIHGVNSSPQTSENFLKSLNISKEIKGMRVKIDHQLYQIDDLQSSHMQYLSELRHPKKGSLDEFIETSVKYAVKLTMNNQLNEELQTIKKQNAASIHGRVIDLNNPHSLDRKSPKTHEIKRNASKISEGNASIRSSNQGKFNNSIHTKIDIKDEKRNAVSVLSSERNANAPNQVEIPIKSGAKSRNQFGQKVTNTQNSIKTHRNSQLGTFIDQEPQSSIHQNMFKRSTVSQDRVSNNSKVSQNYEQIKSIIKPSVKPSMVIQEEQKKSRQPQIQNKSKPTTKYQELLQQQKTATNKTKSQTIQFGQQKNKIDMQKKPQNQVLLTSESQESNPSRFKQVNLKNSDTRGAPLQMNSNLNSKLAKPSMVKGDKNIRKSNEELNKRDKRYVNQAQRSQENNKQYSKSYNDRLQEKNKGLQYMMSDSKNASNPYVNFHHKSNERKSGLSTPMQQDARTNEDPSEHFSNISGKQSNQTPSRSLSNTIGGNSVSKRMQTHRPPSQQTYTHSSATRRSKQARRQQHQMVVKDYGQGQSRQTVDEQGSKLADLTGEKITLFDLGSCDEIIENNNDIVDIQLQHGSLPRVSTNTNENQKLSTSGGFEGFAANIDLNNVRQSKLHPTNDIVPLSRQQNRNVVHDQEKSLRLNETGFVFDRSGNNSRQINNVSSSNMQSTNSIGKKLRTPRTLEPEPEFIDKNIPTDNTPENDLTADNYDTTPTGQDKFVDDHKAQILKAEYFKGQHLIDIPQGPTRAMAFRENLTNQYTFDQPTQKLAPGSPKNKQIYNNTDGKFNKIQNSDNKSLGRPSSSTIELNSDQKNYLENLKNQSQGSSSKRNYEHVDRQKHLSIPGTTKNEDRPPSKGQYQSVYTFNQNHSDANRVDNESSNQLQGSKNNEEIHFGTITSVQQTQGLESDVQNDTNKSSQIFERAKDKRPSVQHTGNFNTANPTELDDQSKSQKSLRSMRPSQRQSQLSGYSESAHREVLRRDRSRSTSKDRHRSRSRDLSIRSSQERERTSRSSERGARRTPQGQRPPKTVKLTLDEIVNSEDKIDIKNQNAANKAQSKYSMVSPQNSMQNRLKHDPNLPFIFREDPQVVQLRQRSTNDLIDLAFEELQEQICDDIDLEEGQYIFPIEICPKSDREAILHQARKLDSVIDEESDEYNVTNSQYSMQTPAAGGYNYSKVLQTKKIQGDPRSNNKSIQSVNSMKSFTSQEGGYKSSDPNSHLFVVHEDGLGNGAYTAGHATPYVPYTLVKSGRTSDAQSRSSTEENNEFQNQLRSKLNKTSHKSQRILNQRNAAFQRINNSMPGSPGGHMQSSDNI